MIRHLKEKVAEALATRVDATGLAVFRILYSAVLFCEVSQLYRFRHLVYDKVPHVVPSEINWSWPISVWMLSVVLLGLGAFYRWSAFTNYLMALVCVGTIRSYEYHMFYVYMGMNFLLMFMPAANALSVDSLISRMRMARENLPRLPTHVSILNYRIPVFLGIGLVYFDSCFHKFASHIWLNGLGAWLPANLPMVTLVDSSFLYNNQWLAIGLGYFTVTFELLFIFLFWNLRFAWPLILCGLGLHLGILLELPIPWFALGVSAIYLLLVPPDTWKRLGGIVAWKTLDVFYDGDCPRCRQTKVVFESLDWLRRTDWHDVHASGSKEMLPTEIPDSRLVGTMHSVDARGNVFVGIDTYRQICSRIALLIPIELILSIPVVRRQASKLYMLIARRKGTSPRTDGLNTADVSRTGSVLESDLNRSHRAWAITLFLCLVAFMQLLMIAESPVVRQAERKLGIQKSSLVGYMHYLSRCVRQFSQPALGITPHGVFMDPHFNGYNHQIRVIHDTSNTVLPISSDDGVPSSYASGFLWVKWTFRVNSPHVNQKRLEDGLRDFTAFWLVENGYTTSGPCTFTVECRKIDMPDEWQRDYYRRQMKKPWFKIGTVRWEQNTFSSNLEIVEET